MKLLDVYRENPFNYLAASAKDARAELIGKQEEMALFGDGPGADQALAALLNPQTRTEAEIRWFPLMDARETQALMAFFDRHWTDTEMPPQSIPSMLGQFNMLRLALSRLQDVTVSEFQAIFRSIAITADALIPGHVMEEINADRRQAGFPEIKSPSEIEPLIRNLLNETVTAYLNQCLGGISDKDLTEMVKAFRAAYKTASSPYHNSYFLEIAADQLDARKKIENSPKPSIPLTYEEKRRKPYQFSKTFTFPREKDTSLKKLNDAIAKMKLSDINIRESKGFLFREETRDNKHNFVSVRYGFGFDSITLDCDQKGELFTWQFDTEVMLKSEYKEVDVTAYNARWRTNHPDRVLSSTMHYTYDSANVIIVLHHSMN